MLDLRRIQALAAVARLGSVSAAAEELGFVPSAISQQISTLEGELGVQLTQREGRGIVLTQAGRLLARRGEDLVERALGTAAAIRHLGSLDGGTLRIAAFQSAGAHLLPGVLETMSREYPRLSLSFAEAEPDASLAKLRRFEVDVAIVYRYDHAAPPDLNGLNRSEVMHDELLFTSSPALNRPGSGSELLAGFQDVPWIVDAPGTPSHEATLAVCRQAGFDPRVGFLTDDYGLAVSLVQRGLGVGLIPAIALASSKPAGLCARSLPARPSRAIETVRRHDCSAESVDTFESLTKAEAAARAKLANADPRSEEEGEECLTRLPSSPVRVRA